MWLSWLIVLVAASSCVAREPERTRVQPDDPRLHYVGWFDRTIPEAPRAAWPGSQVIVSFTGSALWAQLADTSVDDDTRDTDRIETIIDGVSRKTFALAEGSHWYPIAIGLARGVHRAEIWKRTEAEVGVITFEGFMLDAGASLLPAESKARRMLFIGDSITAGYGIESRRSVCRSRSRNANNYDTYGAHAARLLQAEYVASAWSGKGLTRNYEMRDRLTMPQLYERIIPTEDASPLTPRVHADVVSINLGTNDFFRGVPSAATMLDTYGRLIDAVRVRYPKALLVLAVGPMLADDYPQPRARSLMRGWTQQLIAQRHAQGDTAVAFIELWTDPKEGVGCDFHPNRRTHARLGAEFAQLVRERLGW
jgi:lysophospholipase L1-like esterase